MKTVREFLLAVSETAKCERTNAKDWEDLIRRGQALPESVAWTALMAMVQMAIIRGHYTTLYTVVVARYALNAVHGDQEAYQLLYEFARMANDEQLLKRFTISPLEFESSTEGGISSEDLKSLGISADSKRIASGVIAGGTIKFEA